MMDKVLKSRLDLGYVIMSNGDVVTSDGLPRGDLDSSLWPKVFGKPLQFRKPMPGEDGLLVDTMFADQLFGGFKEKSPRQR